MDGMVLTANDTLISIHEAEKYSHQDDNNRIDIVIRRSFDQGRTWQKFQLVHTESNETHSVTINQGTPVLDTLISLPGSAPMIVVELEPAGHSYTGSARTVKGSAS